MKLKNPHLCSQLHSLAQHIGRDLVMNMLSTSMYPAYCHQMCNEEHALPLQVAFVMPSKYRKAEELPRPGNPNVMIRETPAQMLAAISWRCAERRAMHAG